jgi:hypothetical protein
MVPHFCIIGSTNDDPSPTSAGVLAGGRTGTEPPFPLFSVLPLFPVFPVFSIGGVGGIGASPLLRVKRHTPRPTATATSRATRIGVRGDLERGGVENRKSVSAVTGGADGMP